MKASTKERKRAADREAQRINRARTKDYIQHLEKTVQVLSGQQESAALKEDYTKHHKLLTDLQGTLKKIARLANSAVNQDLSQTEEPAAEESKSQSNQQKQSPHSELEDLEVATKSAPIITAVPRTNLHPDKFFGIDFECSDRERNFLLVLGSAFNLIQTYSNDHALLNASPKTDDDICIRAVVDGWEAAEDRYPFDPAWKLLQAVDQGLYYRSDSVTRIALLRGKMGFAQFSIPDYMRAGHIQCTIPHAPFLDFLPLPQFRDYWILSGIDYASESCAAEFTKRIQFVWLFELRDVFLKEVSTGNYLFSHEFDTRYYSSEYWTLDCPSAPMPLLPQYDTLLDHQPTTLDDISTLCENIAEDVQ
ncbi:hypothetical protein FVEG_13242 [Aspergillus niger]|uniref:BZIP domain-containing protein n=1 Tax=Aspergillus niger TaxID=5061 RepID=A0A100I5R1_ASPNG|nr:hypothetical protein FVEG_13242 [Aspergillus niger]